MPGFQFGNHSLELIFFASSALLIFSVVASKISTKFGVPTLLIFLGIGMLAGSEGPIGIDFSNYPLAFAIGSVSLAYILFDGGASTSWQSVRPIIGVGISLSLVGVIATAAAVGAFAYYVLGLGGTESLLLGAIVSSTDAAAVFSILRSNNLALKGTVKQTLEFEAGSNDPTAIFLTAGVLTVATSLNSGPESLLIMLLMQGGLGVLVGWSSGHVVRWLINHIRIEQEGLYSVLLFGLVMLVFSITAVAGGSGFLAVYVMGLILGNSEMLHKKSMLRFHDGIAWIAQISVFLALGLLSYPSHLLSVWKEGVLLALFMMFVARPVSVLVAAPTRRFDLQERIFIMWVGLRGAAPVILATLPWSVNFPNAEYLFNLVFFVVLLSVLIQGLSIPWVANKLELTEPLKEESPDEIKSGLLPPGFIRVEMELLPGAAAEHRRVIDLTLPSGVLLTNLDRDRRYIVPKGDTVFEAGDRIWALARPSNIEVLKAIFGKARPI